MKTKKTKQSSSKLQRVEHENLGSIAVKISSQSSRYITMRHHIRHGFLVTLPRSFSMSKALAYVKDNEQQLWKKFAPMAKKIQDNRLSMEKEIPTLNGTYYFAFHEKVRVMVVREKKKTILIPEKYRSDGEKLGEVLYKSVIAELKKQAQLALPVLTEKFSRQYALPYTKISFRDMSSRWGSCSYQNHLSYNVHLMRLPLPLIEYVVKHELAHVQEKNHGPKFWQLLNKMCDNQAKRLAQAVKKFDMAKW